MAFEWSRLGMVRPIGFTISTSANTMALDAAYVHYTSGDALGCRFLSPITQTSAALTVYAYCSAAVTGSPTDVRCVLRNGPQGTDDIDRPEAADSPLGTSSAVDMSAQSAAGWVTFSIASASLVRGQTYYLLLDNRTATPASNFPTFATRALVSLGTSLFHKLFQGIYTTAGYSADGTAENYAPAMVIKFSDGSLLGNPYVAPETHANNTNDRGMCVTPANDIVVSGCTIGAGATQWSGIKIRVSGGADVITASFDRAGGQVQGAGARFAPTTLSGGTRYDVLATMGSSGIAGPIFTMGEASPPADVQACVWPGAGYCDNTTIDATKIMVMALLVDEHPVVAGGGGPLVGASVLISA